MYKILLNKTLFYDAGVEELAIFSGSLSKEVNKVDSFKFSVYPKHPRYNELTKLRGLIEIYDDNQLLFEGRILNDTIDLDKRKEILAEGALAYLNDSVYRPYTYEGTVRGFVERLINNHNDMVDESKRFVLGHVDNDIDPNDYITRSSIEAKKTWTVFNESILKLLDCYVYVDYPDGVRTLNLYKDSPFGTSQDVEIGRNILDLSKYAKGEKMTTAVIPYGARLKDENGADTDVRLTISSVNSGLDYIKDDVAVGLYGFIYDVIVFDDVELATNLKSKAETYLATVALFQNNITIGVIDLNLVDKAYQKLRVFSYVHVKTAQLDYDDTVLIRKRTYDLIDPANDTIVLDSSYASLTDKNLSTDNMVKNIYADYVVNETVRVITERIHTVESAIEQLPDLIQLWVREEVRDYQFPNIVKNFTAQDGNQDGIQYISDFIYSKPQGTSQEEMAYFGTEKKWYFTKKDRSSPIARIVEVGSDSGSGFEFYNAGQQLFSRSPAIPDTKYYLRVMTQGAGKLKFVVREYNHETLIHETVIANSVESVEFVELLGEITLSSNTTSIRMIVEADLDSYGLNPERATHTDGMFNQGVAKTWGLTAGEVYEMSKSLIKIESDRIDLSNQRIEQVNDYAGNIETRIDNTLVRITALQGVQIWSTSGRGLTIYDTTGLETVSLMTNGRLKAVEAEFVDCLITGTLTAGKVGDWTIVSGLIESRNGVIVLDAYNEVIEFGANTLSYVSNPEYNLLRLGGSSGKRVAFHVNNDSLNGISEIEASGDTGGKILQMVAGKESAGSPTGFYAIGFGEQIEQGLIMYPYYYGNKMTLVADLLHVPMIRIGNTNYTISRRSSDGAMILTP